MLKNYLSASDVCSIIESCGKNKIAILKFGDLELRMGLPMYPDPDFMPPPTRTQVPEAEISEEQRKEAEKAHVQRELAAAAIEQEELILSDPARYEELVSTGALDEDESIPNTEEA